MAKLNLLTKEQVDEIILAYDICRNQQKVCEITRHSPSTVSKYLIANGRGCGQGGNPNYVITDEQILKGIAEGLSRQEIADKYGTHVENLAKRMKKLGVHARQAKSKNETDADSWHYTENAKQFCEKYQSGFEFVSYKRGKYKLRCKTCGSVMERWKSSIRRSECHCEKCKDDMRTKEELERLENSFVGEFRKCTCCGEYYFAVRKNSLYCSAKCKRKSKKIRRKQRDPEYGKSKHRFRREKSYIQRAKKYGCEYEYGITIKSVFNRDGGVCKICGKPCDLNDRSYGCYGPNYPTVDHIIPLSKGGPHTWDNVQLAHAICNSYKRDLTR